MTDTRITVEAGPRTYLGQTGHIAGWDVFITGRKIVAMKDGKTVRHEVPCYGEGSDMATFSQKPEFKIGWGDTGDFEVIGFYDKADGNFGYALNLNWNEGEWTYCYFGTEIDG